MSSRKKNSENGGDLDGTSTVSGEIRYWKPVALITIVIAVTAIAYFTGLGKKIAGFRGWIESSGVFAPFIFTGIYILTIVIAIPGSMMTVTAGALFGSIIGVILVSIASTTGAGLCFLISRYFARDTVRKWLAGKEKFQRLDKLTEEHGAIVVAIVRLVPVFPYNLINYGLGLTGIGFWTYLFWSWLCMLPGTVMYVVGTDVVIRAAAKGDIPWTLIIILVTSIGIMVYLAKMARKKLKTDERERSEND